MYDFYLCLSQLQIMELDHLSQQRHRLNYIRFPLHESIHSQQRGSGSRCSFIEWMGFIIGGTPLSCCGLIHLWCAEPDGDGVGFCRFLGLLFDSFCRDCPDIACCPEGANSSFLALLVEFDFISAG